VADRCEAGEDVTAPDNGIEEALRRALAEAVSQVETGPDALERIRARIGQRPPRPWLLSVAADVLGRAGHWTWRGHWAWQLPWAWPATIPALSALPWPRLQRLPRPGARRPAAAPRPGPARPARLFRVETVNWLRPVGVLAGIAIIASVSFGVQPFRQAIIQASSTVLSGGQPQSGGAGTEGIGLPTGDVTSSSGTGTPPADTYGTAPGPGAIASSDAASASPAPSPDCPPSLMVDWTSALVHKTADAAGSVTSAAPNTAGNLMPSAPPSAPPTPSPAPSCASASSPAVSPTPSPTVSATPSASATSPTPTPTATSTSPTATPTGTSPSPTATPTPTATGSDSPTPTPTDSAIETGDGGAPVTGTPGVTPTATPS
jgi:hypothetical protein